MRIAVTGATGLVGGQVVRAALDAGHEVRAVVRRPGGAGLQGVDVQQVRAGLQDGEALRRALDGCAAVVHCAAVYAFEAGRAEEIERVNTLGTRTLVEAAAAAGARRVVVTSSSVTRGSGTRPVPRTELDTLGMEPSPTYYTSKVEQEQIALEAGERVGVEVVLALPTVVLGGPAARLLPSNAIVLRYLMDPTRSTFSGGCNVVDARDVAVGHLLLVEAGRPGERYLLGGQDLTWRELHRIVAELAGLPGPFAEVPQPVAYLAAAASELWGKVTSAQPLSTRDEATTVGRWYWYDHSPAAALGYRPRPARDAVASSLAWLAVGPHLPRWVREGLRLSPEVLAARPLVPRALA